MTYDIFACIFNMTARISNVTLLKSPHFRLVATEAMTLFVSFKKQQRLFVFSKS